VIGGFMRAVALVIKNNAKGCIKRTAYADNIKSKREAKKRLPLQH